jgi:predicted permease
MRNAPGETGKGTGHAAVRLRDQDRAETVKGARTRPPQLVDRHELSLTKRLRHPGCSTQEQMWSDLRYGVRRLRATPGFTAVSVATLAISLGANTAIFTLVDTLYLKPLAIDASDRLVHLYARRPGGGFEAGFSESEYESLRTRLHAVTALAAETPVAQLHLVTPTAVREVRGNFVSATYFDIVGVRPTRGRAFVPDEDLVPGRNPVAVISDRLWRDVFGASATAVGATVRINGLAVAIVGVTPLGFYGDDSSRGADVWLPAAMLAPAGYGCDRGEDCNLVELLLGRLRPGARVTTARAEAAAMIQWTPSLDRNPARHRAVVVDPIAGADPDTRELLRPQMELLLALTGLLLLITCANLAGLVLGRALTRRREIAVRLSIGATRARIVRQLVTEAFVISALGGAAGVLVSRWLIDLLAGFYRIDSEGFAHSYDFGTDPRVFVFAFIIVLVATLLVGLVPALQACRSDIAAELKDGRGADPSWRVRRLRHALVVAQVALSLMLLVSSMLLARSSGVVRGGTHFDPAHVAVLRLRPELTRMDPTAAEAFMRSVSDRLRGTPGVQAVGMMIGGEGLVWHWASGPRRAIALPAQRRGASAPLTVASQDVDAAFFDALRIPISEGRAFTSEDRAGAPPVAILNETLARLLWPRQSAVGQRLAVDDRLYSVVGIAADIQPANAVTPTAGHLYLPFWQTNAASKTDVRFAIRVAGGPAAFLPRFREAIHRLNPDVPIGEDMPLADQIALEYAPILLAERVTIACGLLALALSAMGLYCVLALTMRSRIREIGIRIAIGAQPREIAGQFLRQALALGLAGVGTGLAGAWVAAQFIAAWLYGVNAHDTGAFAFGAGVLLVVTLLAGVMPAARAARLDPIVALRQG